MLQEVEGLFASMERIVSLRSRLLDLLREAGSRGTEAGLRRALAEQVGLRDSYTRMIAAQIGMAGLPLGELHAHLSEPQQRRLQSCLARDRELSRRLQTVSCRRTQRKLFLHTIFSA